MNKDMEKKNHIFLCLDKLLYCVYDIFQSLFLLGILYIRSEFATFCHDLMSNHVVSTYAQKVLF